MPGAYVQLCGSVLHGGSIKQRLEVSDPERITAVYVCKPPKLKPNSRSVIIHCWAKMENFSYTHETDKERAQVDALVSYVQECQQRKRDERHELGRKVTVDQLTSTAVGMKNWLGIQGHEVTLERTSTLPVPAQVDYDLVKNLKRY